MCGILAFVSKDNRYPVTDRHVNLASSALYARGPDYRSVQVSQDARILVVNTVLSISQEVNSFSFPPLAKNEYFAYNGEIYTSYNYSSSSGKSDTHYLLKQLRSSRYDLGWLYSAQFRGSFAFVYINLAEAKSIELIYGTDFFGERNLFVYEDCRQFIISSIPSLCYRLSEIYSASGLTINRCLISSYIRSRNLLDSPGSCIEEVAIVEPGCVTQKVIASGEARSEYLHRSWSPGYIGQLMTDYKRGSDGQLDLSQAHFISSKEAAASLVISGGVDSSLVAANAQIQRSQNDLAITLTFGARDSVAHHAADLACKLGIIRHIVHDISLSEYAEGVRKCFELLLSPLPTHSYPSTYMLGKLASAYKTRIIYGGDGADEFHIGYPQYLDTLNRRPHSSIYSPYNSFECDSEISILGFECLFSEADELRSERLMTSQQYVDMFLSHGMSNQEAAIKAALVMDIRYNLHSTGLLAGDLIISNSSVESRSPFVFLQSFLRLLCDPLSVPISRCKPRLTDSFREIFGIQPFQKQGFSGFPNEVGKILLGSRDSSVLPRISSLYNYDIGSVYKKMSRRMRWKMLNCELYLHYVTGL